MLNFWGAGDIWSILRCCNLSHFSYMNCSSLEILIRIFLASFFGTARTLEPRFVAQHEFERKRFATLNADNPTENRPNGRARAILFVSCNQRYGTLETSSQNAQGFSGTGTCQIGFGIGWFRPGKVLVRDGAVPKTESLGGRSEREQIFLH